MTHTFRPRTTVAAAGAMALLASLLMPGVATAESQRTGVLAPQAAVDELNDLIISEYVEGSSNNKAVEFYNGTSVPINISGYTLQQYTNGATTPNINITLDNGGDNLLQPGQTHVLTHSSSTPALLELADQTSGAGLFNGNDSLVLRGPGNAVVDSFGQVGNADDFAINVTLARKADICAGDTVIDDPWDPAVEWDAFPVDTFSGIGAHTTTCEPGEGPGDPGDPGDPDPPIGECGDPAMAIGEVQGSGSATPVAGETVTVEGVVIGSFPGTVGYNGYYVQDEGDDDPATSDGIFIFAPEHPGYDEGTAVRVTGTASEFFSMTQITQDGVLVCDTDVDLPEPVELILPVDDYEPFEGMLVTLPQDLAILEFFNYGRYGEVVIGTERQFQPTAIFEPGSEEAVELLAKNRSERITLDDGLNAQNPAFLRHPNGEAFTLENRFRGGDLVTDTTGVLDFRFSLWRIQPTAPAQFTEVNERPEVPDVGGTLTVASFNVLNYFTTLGSRGAANEIEFERQQAKIVSAIVDMDADITGLIEIENNDDVAVNNLVDAVNERVGEPRWAAVQTGSIGTDEITTAFIYQVESVRPVGHIGLLDSSVDERFLDAYNRPALAQTFFQVNGGGLVTVVNNHLKSKGSDCNAVGDPEDPNGQGNCNGVRTQAAEAMADWLNAPCGDRYGQRSLECPTGVDTDNVLIIGDLNSYGKEDPIMALADAGFQDLLQVHQGEFAYSYVFDGMLGYLDYALANEALATHVTGAQAWFSNADEPSVLDYTTRFKPVEQQALYAPDAFRASDHDAVLIGLDLNREAAPDGNGALALTGRRG